MQKMPIMENKCSTVLLIFLLFRHTLSFPESYSLIRKPKSELNDNSLAKLYDEEEV